MFGAEVCVKLSEDLEKKCVSTLLRNVWSALGKWSKVRNKVNTQNTVNGLCMDPTLGVAGVERGQRTSTEVV